MEQVVPQAEKTRLTGIIAKHLEKPGALLGILEEAQQGERWHYLPEETLSFIAKETNTPLSRVYSVATFYSFFNLKPQGLHSCVVCRGTACHTRGSKAILEEALKLLGISAGDESEAPWTTPDKQFSIRTVACFGQCALAPVVQIDEVIYSRVTSASLANILKRVAKGASK